MALNPKQLRFVQEYLIDLNATQAAIRAGITLESFANQAGAYVYLLTDPRTNSVFYVGKGSGKRALTHQGAERKGRHSNGSLALRIQEIRVAGMAPQTWLLDHGLSHRRALQVERHLIQAWRKTLTNRAKGIISSSENTEMQARHLLNRVKPFEAWRAERNPTDAEIEMYGKVVAGLKSISNGEFSGGWISP